MGVGAANVSPTGVVCAAGPDEALGGSAAICSAGLQLAEVFTVLH